MTVTNQLIRSQIFIDKIVLFQCATPSGSYGTPAKVVGFIFMRNCYIAYCLLNTQAESL